MLITSVFSFYQINVFYPIKDKLAFTATFNL